MQNHSFLFDLASLWAALTAFRNPFFFHDPFFSLNCGAIFLNARPYLLEAADAFRFFGAF